MCVKIMNMSLDNKELAIELAENMSDLAETAFGWDSLEAAQCRRELGLRYRASELWELAIRHLRSATEAFQVLNGAESIQIQALRKVIKVSNRFIFLFTINDDGLIIGM
jgi:hypothetical protein